MARHSSLRFGAQTDEVTSLLHVVNLVRLGEAATRPEIGRLTGLGRGAVTQRIDQAIELGYLEDGEFGPSSGAGHRGPCDSDPVRGASSSAPWAPCTSMSASPPSRATCWTSAIGAGTSRAGRERRSRRRWP
ncbi:hypothetical protein [Naasia aerilata]|uniref:hypothetical protein n=1 Tax=Naasia aerilata TaxID=1162966 RepID=UPI002573D337|nr:hypothetical protein [Naasia aerilata]